MIDGIKAGQIGYLGIDVYEREDELFFQDLSDTIIQDDIFHLLQSFSNVIITAHQGFLTRNALANIATTTLESITAPPLRYGDVYRLKQKFPHLWIEINGGITQLPQVQDYLERVNGVMIGRAAYDHPYLFATVDGAFLGTPGGGRSRQQVVEAMLPYLETWLGQGLKLNKITRHMLMLFAGQPGSRLWKQHLTEQPCRPGAGVEVVTQALAAVNGIGLAG